MLNHFSIFSKNVRSVFVKLVLLSAFVSVAQAATPSIQMRLEVSPREITIGDVIQYQAVVKFSSHVTPAPLDIPDPWGTFELRDYNPGPQQKLPDGKFQMSHAFQITTFSTGTQTIPSININFVTASGEQVQAATESIDINVISLLEKYGDEGNLRPFRGPYNFKSYLWLWITLGVLLLGAVGYYVYRQIQNKRKNAPEKEKPCKPPEQIAWDSIHALEDSELLTNGDTKEFYIRLSEIFRQYLEDRYQMSALERTTSELMNAFRHQGFKSEITSLMRMLLDNGDLVKFAKYTPDEEEVEKDLERLKQIVTMTTPQKDKKPEEKEKIPV